jgi:hypothetical protein
MKTATKTPISTQSTIRIKGKEVKLLFNSFALDGYLSKLRQLELSTIDFLTSAHITSLIWAAANAYSFQYEENVQATLADISEEVEKLIVTPKGFVKLEEIAQDFISTKSVSKILEALKK